MGCRRLALVQRLNEIDALKRFIITGAPGAGKTAIIRQLALDGFSVVEEAATDVIAAAHARGVQEPWTHSSFISDIVAMQRERQLRATGDLQFHDRSAICTAALATYLGYPFSPALTAELERVNKDAIFQRRVFFIRHLGFVTPTEARRITFEETLRFERIHEETYRDFGYEMVFIQPANVAVRLGMIKESIRAH